MKMSCPNSRSQRSLRRCLAVLVVGASMSAILGLGLRILVSRNTVRLPPGEATQIEVANNRERGNTTLEFLKEVQRVVALDERAKAEANRAWDALSIDGVDADVLLHIDFYLDVLQQLADLKQREFFARLGIAFFDIATRPEKPSELLQYEDRAKYHETLDLYEIADQLHGQQALMHQATIGEAVQAKLINLQAGVQTMESKLSERLIDRYGEIGEQIVGELARFKREHLDQAKHSLRGEYVPRGGVPAVDRLELPEAARDGTILFKLVASFPEDGLYKVVLMNRTERELTVTAPIGTTFTGLRDIVLVGLSKNRDSAAINAVTLPSLYPVSFYLRGYRVDSTPLAEVDYRNFAPASAGPPMDAVIRNWLGATSRTTIDDSTQQRILLYRHNLSLQELNDWSTRWNLAKTDYDARQQEVVDAIQKHHDKLRGLLDKTTFRRMIDAYAKVQNAHSIWRQETPEKIVIHETVFERSSGRMLSRAGDFQKPNPIGGREAMRFQSGLQEIYDGHETRSQSVSRIVVGPHEKRHHQPLGLRSLTNMDKYELLLLRHPHDIRLDLYLPEVYSVEELPPDAAEPRPGLRFSSRDADNPDRTQVIAFELRLNPQSYLIESVGDGDRAVWQLIARDTSPVITPSTFEWDTQFRALSLRMEAVRRLIEAELPDHLKLPDLSADPPTVVASANGEPLPEGRALRILLRAPLDHDRPAVCRDNDDRKEAGLTASHLRDLFVKAWKRKKYADYKSEMLIVVPGGRVTKVAPDVIGQTLNVHWEPDPQAQAPAEAVLVSAPSGARIQRVEWRPTKPAALSRDLARTPTMTASSDAASANPVDPMESTKQAFREWTDYRGNKIRARLLSYDGKNVTLEDTRKRTITMPSVRFSAEDRRYLRSIGKQ